MRVLVTGVSGFVGCRLAPYLVSRGHEVTGTYIHTVPPLDGVETVEVDLLDDEKLGGIFERTDADAIVHLAGLSHVGESWQRPAEYFQVNVLGSKNVLQAAGDARVLVASSAEVYGAVPTAEQPISELRPVAPQSPYAMTKAAMELLALEHEAIVVRSFNIVGPGQADSFALPAFANQLAAIERQGSAGELRVGNLCAKRDFVHVDDAVEAIALVLESGQSGEIYNLGSGRAESIDDVLQRLIAISGLSPEVIVNPERFRPVDVPLLQADRSHLSELGWSPSRGLEVALRDLWEFALSESSVSVGEDAKPSNG
ncbi:MAG: GDP-mannose 4,6-dehydratase, partial [Acidobacteriota bacterium]